MVGHLLEGGEGISSLSHPVHAVRCAKTASVISLDPRPAIYYAIVNFIAAAKISWDLWLSDNLAEIRVSSIIDNLRFAIDISPARGLVRTSTIATLQVRTHITFEALSNSRSSCPIHHLQV